MFGSWSTGYPDIYALDFGSVTAPGAYTIVISGPIAGSSPTFTIDTAANFQALLDWCREAQQTGWS